MTVQIEIDEEVLAEVEDAIKILEENREDVFREAFRELAEKKKREAEVRKQYAKAYGEKPVQPEEFEVEDEQLTEAWKDL